MGIGWGWGQDAWGWDGDGDNVTGMGWGWVVSSSPCQSLVWGRSRSFKMAPFDRPCIAQWIGKQAKCSLAKNVLQIVVPLISRRSRRRC